LNLTQYERLAVDEWVVKGASRMHGRGEGDAVGPG
jgi:hypothetical protein